MMDLSITINFWFIVALWLLGVVVGMLLAVPKHR
jgi:hypothetical protein